MVGASNFGRELESWLNLIPANERNWEFSGYLHTYTDKSPLEGFPSDFQIVGEWENFTFRENDLCIISLADCYWKEKVFMHLKNKVKFFTFISPDAIIGKYNEIGEGSVICPRSLLSTNVKLGKCVTINCGTQIGHDVKVGDFSSLMSQIEIGGGAEILNKAFIGSGASILPKIRIETEGIVGAGSVVIKNVRMKTTVFGNPAKVISY